MPAASTKASARIRPVLIEDIACTLAYEGYLKILAIAARVTQLDEVPMAVETLLAMRVIDGNPIVEAVAKQMINGAASKGIA